MDKFQNIIFLAIILLSVRLSFGEKVEHKIKYQKYNNRKRNKLLALYKKLSSTYYLFKIVKT